MSLITVFLAPVPPLGFSKSSATLAAADPCTPRLGYGAPWLLEYWEVIPNARFPLSSMLPTHISPHGILHSPTTPSDPLVVLDLLDLGSTIDVALRVSHPGAFLAVALHPIPLATSSRFGEIPGGKGLGTDWSRFLYMTGVSIPHGLAHMGKRGIGQLLLHAPWSKTATKAASFRSWLIGSDSENMRGASECLVPECFVQVSAPPPSSSSARASRPGHPSVNDARTSRGAGGSWEPPYAAARVQSPIWAVCLDMVTRSSHTQLMQSQHARPDSMLVPNWASPLLHRLHGERSLLCSHSHSHPQPAASSR